MAQQYNSTVDAITQRNQLANPNLIQIGQQLIIPDSATSSVSQTAGNGDTTSATAANVTSAAASASTNSNDTTISNANNVATPLSSNTVNLTSALGSNTGSQTSNSADTLATSLDQVTTLSNTPTSEATATTSATTAAATQTSYEANSAAALQSMSNYTISYGTVEETAASYNSAGQSAAQPAQSAANDTASQASDATSTNTSSAVATARSMIGVPYVWGGNTPSGFDCSGLVQYAYNLGPNYRTTYQQTNLGQHKYDVENAQSGDLYFWGTESAPYHVAIAEGNGNYIQAPTPGQNVQEGNIQYYRPNFYISMNQ